MLDDLARNIDFQKHHITRNADASNCWIFKNFVFPFFFVWCSEYSSYSENITTKDVAYCLHCNLFRPNNGDKGVMIQALEFMSYREPVCKVKQSVRTMK